MPSEESESGLAQEVGPADVKIVTHDGHPAVEFPSGERLELRVHVNEFSHETPNFGDAVEMTTEVDADDHAWWTLSPERRSAGPNTPEDYPEIVIEPYAREAADE